MLPAGAAPRRSPPKSRCELSSDWPQNCTWAERVCPRASIHSSLALAVAMPPKKKANTFAESSGTVDGWPFKVYGNGLVKVGTANSGQYKNWTVRLTSFDDVDPSNCAEHKECVRLERISRELPHGPDGNGCEGQKQAGGDHFELPATQTDARIQKWRGKLFVADGLQLCPRRVTSASAKDPGGSLVLTEL